MSKWDDVLTNSERLELWCELCALVAAMQEYANWWWQLDKGMRAESDRRAGIPHVDDDEEVDF